MTKKRYRKLQMAWRAELTKQAKAGGYDNKGSHYVMHKIDTPKWDILGYRDYAKAWAYLQNTLYMPVGK